MSGSFWQFAAYLKPMMSKLVSTLFLLISSYLVSAQEYILSSPDGKLKSEIVVSANTVFRLYHKGQILLHGKPIGMTIGKKNNLGSKEYEPKSTTEEVDRIVKPIVSSRFSTIRENYNSLLLEFKSGLSVEFRCYDDGFAYRLITSFDKPMKVKSERMGFEVTSNPTCWFPKETSFNSHNERHYKPTTNHELKPNEKASLPVLWQWGKGPFMLFTETDLRDYPGMYIQTDGEGEYKAIFPKYPATTAKLFDRFEPVGFTKTYLADTEGSRTFPWRIFCVADDEQELLSTQLPYLLSEETELESTDWIKPGKVAWDWWNALKLEGVDFKPGLNTQTYKYYIDFAAENNLEYIIMDEGWYKLGDLLNVKKDIDMPELIRYANEKNVGIILWVVWRTLEKQFEPAFEQFSNWGVKGIKMDFMMRTDQPMVAFYEKVAKEAAKRQLLVDFHGSHCPKGLQRTYPNVLTYEGVRGLEWNKWSSALTVDHDVTIPYTRMLAGPMDYTPGAMTNISDPKKHKMNYKKPKSQGTRCHELAKYVIYESPLQMLADAPTAYQKEPECMKFLSDVPSVWDTTIVLDATVAEHIVLARKKNDVWYVGGMTGSVGQTLSINLDFLNEGNYTMDVWRDGEETAARGSNYEFFVENQVNSEMKYVISMASGGGWVGVIKKK